MKFIHSASALQIEAIQILTVKRRRSRSAPGFVLQLTNGHDFIAGLGMLTTEREPVAGDYVMFYEGRTAVVEKSIIDQNYMPADAICFGRAIQLLKRGARIAQASWKADSWICLGDAHPGLEADKFWNVHTRALAEANGGTAPVHQYIIHAEDGQIQMGWTASQAQTLAEDWRVV